VKSGRARTIPRISRIPETRSIESIPHQILEDGSLLFLKRKMQNNIGKIDSVKKRCQFWFKGGGKAENQKRRWLSLKSHQLLFLLFPHHL
jgi:hypothetical protein